MRPRHYMRKHFRRGTVTVIVVAFLALLAVVGLTFLIASQNYSVSSRIRREHENKDDAPIPTEIFNSVLGDIIYDAPDDATGVKKPIRGHSLSRAMYGIHPNAGGWNAMPYAGIGRARGYIPTQLAALGATEDFGLLNYTYFQGDGFVRDPERYARDPIPLRTNPNTNVGTLGDGTTTTNLPVYWPWNANYTYPDENNTYLAGVDWNTGRVLMPSYYRASAFGTPTAGDPWALAPPYLPTGAVNPAANPNWLSQLGKYMIMRPRPAEHPNFPYPQQNSDGTYGDVENLQGKDTPQKDSFWMDFDLPVKVWRGKRYKPLIALLVVDLDGRLNLNVAGNARGPGGTHGANQGWGPWEMNPVSVLAGNTTDATNLLYGTGNIPGRYGRTAAPAIPPVITKRFTTHHSSDPNDTMVNHAPAGGYLPHFYAPVDYDGTFFPKPAPGAPAPAKWRIPQPNGAAGFEQFAVWGPNTQTPPQLYDYDNRYWNGETDAGYSERIYHPSLYNPYLREPQQSPSTPTAATRTFGTQEMAYLARRHKEADTNFYRNTALGQLLATVPLSARVRSQITTMSNDLDRPGHTPGLSLGDPNLNASGVIGQPANFAFAAPSSFDPTTNPGDADATRRGMAAVLGAIDVTRPLTDYRTNTALKYAATNLNVGQVAQAVRDRQRLAADIFVRLRAATGTREVSSLPAYNPMTANPPYDAVRWLAQLAVNIVDYIDNDDYSTPFKWTDVQGGAAVPLGTDDLRNDSIVRQHYVFGTELPRLVINEVFTYYENDPDDNGINNPPAMTPRRATTKYVGKVWIELHNPLTPQTAEQTRMLSDDGAAVLNNGTYDLYQLSIARPDTNLYHAENTRGTPYNGNLPSTVPIVAPMPPNEQTSLFPAGKAVLPNTLNTGSSYGPNGSFLVVGPTLDSATRMAGTPCVLPDASGYQGTAMFPTVAMSNLAYDIPLPMGAMATDPPSTTDLGNTNLYPTVVLRRLANQHLPPGADNPYVTVDTLRTDPSWMYNHVQYNQGGAVAMPPDWTNAYSYGRFQPYQGFVVPTDAPAPPAPGATAIRSNPNPNPGNTNVKMAFGRHNGQDTTGAAPGTTLKPQFDWPVHLDRALVSPIELAHVSACKPSEFTHYFRPGANPAVPQHVHTADWFNDGNRLYRAFDLLRVGNRTHGLGNGGRVPGKVNINTLNFTANPATDKAVFDSVCHLGSGLAGNNYSVADTLAAWNAMNTAKWPTGQPQFNFQDRPFFGTMGPVGTGGAQFPTTGGARTILNPFLTAAVPKNHPYSRTELLQTVMNNFTTRSNTFAVYATVGYFEVEGTNSHGHAQLGRELVSETGAVTRHRFFAIVDRTQLAFNAYDVRNQAPSPVYFSYEPVAYGTSATNPQPNAVTTSTADPTGGQYVTLAIPCTNANTTTAIGTYDGRQWTINANSQFLLDHQPDAGFGNGAVNGSTLVPNSVGANVTRNRAETVTVAPIPNSIVPDLANGRVLVTVLMNKTHARGATLVLTNPMPGSTPISATPGAPGPQPKFNYLGEAYRGVVPHVEQTE